ncbi:hypothetical protein Patl1_14169 [Pistacia atlantica]|uniref:Uncharacterized protein n=1 Tax=Pistacia atlantica TaxID=434234 RepID=A0ACC1AWD1_9ROSI|nr:hypothetical protein Patl1_14169 [Pistacia atlantica]
MMPASTIEQHQEESSTNGAIQGRSGPFANLRGVQWRVNLGILPPSSSIDDLRRVTADSRRRYAGLRRRLLVDPHLPKDGSNSPDPVMDNPLSQNPVFAVQLLASEIAHGVASFGVLSLKKWLTRTYHVYIQNMGVTSRHLDAKAC